MNALAIGLPMTTKLNGILKRELPINGEPYTLTLSEAGFTLTLKGRRKGLDIRWADLVGGDAALATALNASLTANIVPRGKPAPKTRGEAEHAVRPARKPATTKDRELQPVRPKIEPAARSRGKEPRSGRPKPKAQRTSSLRRR